MADQKKRRIPFLHEIPLYPGEWPGLRNFLVEVRQKIESLMGDPTTPGQVSSFSVTAQSYGGVVEIEWEPVRNAQSYRIYRNTERDLGTAAVVAEVFGNLTSRYVDSILTAGTYYYWLSTVNSLGTEGVPYDLTGTSGTAVSPAPADASYVLSSASGSLPNSRVATNGATVTWDTSVGGQIAAVRAALSGDVTASSGSNATTIAPGAVTSSKANLAVRGWTQTCVFSVTDSDTVSWSSGAFTASDGTAYSIGAGNTGNMTALTYIYLDIAVSTTAYQTTTTAANAVGDGRVLIGVAQNHATEAVFQIFGGVGGITLAAENIVAQSITANEIAANTITAGKLSISTLSAITADLGAITAGSLDAVTITSGTITGTTIKTAVSGLRVEIDSTNGVRFYNSGGTLTAQLNGETLQFNYGTIILGAASSSGAKLKTGSGIFSTTILTLLGNASSDSDLANFMANNIRAGKDSDGAGPGGVFMSGQAVTNSGVGWVWDGYGYIGGDTNTLRVVNGAVNGLAKVKALSYNLNASVLLKEDSGILVVRNNADSAYADFQCNNITAVDINATEVAATIVASGGFNGSGNFTNFTFVDGICTDAS